MNPTNYLIDEEVPMTVQEIIDVLSSVKDKTKKTNVTGCYGADGGNIYKIDEYDHEIMIETDVFTG